MKAATAGVTILLMTMAIACPLSASEPPQPSSYDNLLYLRYDSTTKECWMNADSADEHSESLTKATGLVNRMSIIFPLEPKMNRTNFLVMNTSRDWVINLDIDMKTRLGIYDCSITDVFVSLTIGNSTLSHREPTLARGHHSFNISVGINIINPAWDIIFNFSYKGGSDMDPLYVTIYTDGESNLVLPINRTDIDTDFDGTPDSLDPDDDNDGHADREDAYPLDPFRWAIPGDAWPDAAGLRIIVPAVAASGVFFALAFVMLRRRRRRLRSAEPPLK